MGIHEIKINGQRVDFSFDQLGYRLNRFNQSAANFITKGGDYSSSISFPTTKNNMRVFGITSHLSSINKFNRSKPFVGEIFMDGVKIMSGIFKLTSISGQRIEGDFIGDNISWVELLSDMSLQQVGYVNNAPTWLAEFKGGQTINIINEMDNTQTDIMCPTIIYNNTPITDYFDFKLFDITGTYDTDGNQLSSPKDFPADFETRHGFIGLRQGLTFEDFPPAVYYSNLLKKIFDTIGYTIDGQIFQEEWFNKIVMPYTGTGYKYNWKTLAKLYVEASNRVLTSADFLPSIKETFDNYVHSTTANYPNFGVNIMDRVGFVYQNIGFTDVISNRVDYISNFKKYQVTDDTGEYICPVDGRYKVRVKSKVTKTINPTAAPAATTYLNTHTDKWEDNVLVIYRKSQDDLFALNEDSLMNMQEWATEDRTNFVNEPSDIIACINVSKYVALGYTDATVGTPLSLNEEVVTVNLTTQNTIITPTWTSTSEVDIEVEMDMLMNERIGFAWGCVGEITNSIDSPYVILNVELDVNDVDSRIEVDYLCGNEDIDIASNLPDISCKDFVSSFIKQFNLSFTVNETSKTVNVAYADNFYSPATTAYEIDSRVNKDSVTIYPSNTPKKYNVGYTNDNKDYLLNTFVSNCIVNDALTSDYANVVELSNDNIYAEGTLDITNLFSSTKFVYNNFELLDIDSPFTMTEPTFTIPAGLIGVLDTGIKKGIQYAGTKMIISYLLPSIQSQTSFDCKKLGDLEYDYDYTPRLIYHFGTTSSLLGYPDYRFPIDTPEFALRDNPDFWLRGTVSAFDTENGNTYPSLRYDGLLGLYNTYFTDTVNYLNKTHIIKLDAYLRTSDWTNLKSNRLVKYQQDLYRVMEITDFDPTGVQPSTLTLIKVI